MCMITLQSRLVRTPESKLVLPLMTFNEFYNDSSFSYYLTKLND